MRLQNYINEVFDVMSSDIDMLYEPLDFYLKKFNRIKTQNEFDDFFEEVMKLENPSMSNNYIVKKFKSSKLKSDVCKIADGISPCVINVGFVQETYNPFKKEVNCGISILSVQNKKEGNVNRNKVKSSIRHELTHWIDDVLNNFYLTKIYKTQDWEIITKSGAGELEATEHEIKAQVDQVRELIRRLPSKTRGHINFDIIVKIMKWKHKMKKGIWVKNIKNALKKENII